MWCSEEAIPTTGLPLAVTNETVSNPPVRRETLTIRRIAKATIFIL